MTAPDKGICRETMKVWWIDHFHWRAFRLWAFKCLSLERKLISDSQNIDNNQGGAFKEIYWKSSTNNTKWGRWGRRKTWDFFCPKSNACWSSRSDVVLFVCEDAVMSTLFNVQTVSGEQRLALSAKGAHTCLNRVTCFSLNLWQNDQRSYSSSGLLWLEELESTEQNISAVADKLRESFGDVSASGCACFSTSPLQDGAGGGRPGGLTVSAAPPCPPTRAGWSRCEAEGARCRRCADPPASADRGVLTPGRWWRPGREGVGWDWGRGGAFTV